MLAARILGVDYLKAVTEAIDRYKQRLRKAARSKTRSDNVSQNDLQKLEVLMQKETQWVAAMNALYEGVGCVTVYLGRLIRSLPGNLIACITELHMREFMVGRGQLLQLKLHSMAKLERLCVDCLTGMYAEIPGTSSVLPKSPPSLKHLYLCTTFSAPSVKEIESTMDTYISTFGLFIEYAAPHVECIEWWGLPEGLPDFWVWPKNKPSQSLLSVDGPHCEV